MSSWDQFKRKYSNSINSLKPLITITVYGSYNPKEEKDLLVRIKQILVDSGYEQTRLVEDYQTEGDDPLDVSKQCLLYSDVNLLIFTRAGKRFGLIRELAFIAESADMIPKSQSCVAFDQLEDGRSSIPPLSTSDIKSTGIHYRPYETTVELEQAVIKMVYWQLRRLSPSLSKKL